jgi:phosphoglycolate phosphatase-like HAD superfamily hydrolase
MAARRGTAVGERVRAFAIDLDAALGDTRPLWDAWLASAAGILGVEPESLPADRGAAARELDRLGAGNWRTLLERFSEDRAPVYLRREASVSGALRALASAGHQIGVFTDAPEPLARIALAQLGVARRVDALETGERALERLLERLAPGASVVRMRDELVAYASMPAS